VADFVGRLFRRCRSNRNRQCLRGTQFNTTAIIFIINDLVIWTCFITVVGTRRKLA
jgi:hypothetical protein